MSKPTVLGPQTGYVEIVNHYTQTIIDERLKEPSKYNPLRPSSAGRCARELGYELMQYRGFAKYEQVPNTPEVHRLLNFGYSVENHVLKEFGDAFRKAGNAIEIRYRQQTLSFFKLPDGSRVEGNIDLVLVSDKFKCVADIKSKKEKFSSYYKTSWEELSARMELMKTVHKFGDESFWVEDLTEFLKELNDPFFANNFYQLNMYFFDENKFLREKGVDHAAIFQYSKNDSRLREIRFKPDERLYDYVREKFSKVQQVIDETKDPTQIDREFVLGSVSCGFCKFKSACWPEDDALKAFFNQLPAKQWPKDLDRLSPEIQAELKPLFDEYHSLTDAPDKLDKIEQSIAKVLDRIKVFKIRLNKDTIYRLKRLKSGGSGRTGGKDRLVLRRDKL